MVKTIIETDKDTFQFNFRLNGIYLLFLSRNKQLNKQSSSFLCARWANDATSSSISCWNKFLSIPLNTYLSRAILFIQCSNCTSNWLCSNIYRQPVRNKRRKNWRIFSCFLNDTQLCDINSIVVAIVECPFMWLLWIIW